MFFGYSITFSAFSYLMNKNERYEMFSSKKWTKKFNLQVEKSFVRS